ncbi:MAG: hypothetical protein M3362_05135, partial [Acidobacteriota bacterium]|nr:hypothetical protein [Acidobacteriota bacterium]
TKLRERLQDESYAAARGRGGSPVGVYVNADEMPGAVRPSGTYAVAGSQVTVTLNLIRDGKRVTSFQVAGEKTDLTGLTNRLVAAIAEALKRPL